MPTRERAGLMTLGIEMRELPIRRLMVSDFRRIEGMRELPFDAPVVLIHGPNGTGKTSVLSALELALTGAIRSMERQSDRYRAHLPFFGQPYATVRADVADHLRAETSDQPLTVNGARLDGVPALNEAAAKFYAERCYLDQASLGRLLDLYQHRVGNEQTALELFVNELLGLEKLDALRSGLNDASDFRLLKKLALGVDEADQKSKAIAAQLRDQSALRSEARREVSEARAAARAAMPDLRAETADAMGDGDLIRFIQSAIEDQTNQSEASAATELHQELVAFGGRISALEERPSLQRIEEARAALAEALTAREAWEATGASEIRAWEAAAQAAGVELGTSSHIAVEDALRRAVHDLDNASDARIQFEAVSAQLDSCQVELESINTRLANAHEHSSALVEGLTALRPATEESSVCPVCDRDFMETGVDSLVAHIDVKLAQLTTHGQRLIALRSERESLAASVTRAEVERARLRVHLLSVDEEQTVVQRHAALVDLSARVGAIGMLIAEGSDLAHRVVDRRGSLESLQSASSEQHHVERELARYAEVLGISVLPPFESFSGASTVLLEHAEARVTRHAAGEKMRRLAAIEVARLAAALQREEILARRLADTVEERELWDARLAEAKRRQAVAREVHDAATRARTTIVHRVFTKSLNEVWRTVFTRLAPEEGFIPSFGIPSASKKKFDINLETRHRSGEASGPPQMMLSAGNLNTAALSLFLALHLAVDPLVPCLVFDDPVQAMDEVHVAQFAALIRLLSKQNGRQVVIAVHERELFEYLALELSPAYRGDELITIELGDRAADSDQGVTRHTWNPDVALAN